MSVLLYGDEERGLELRDQIMNFYGNVSGKLVYMYLVTPLYLMHIVDTAPAQLTV